MIYCTNPDCTHPENPDGNLCCQYCGAPIVLRNRFKMLRMLGRGGFGTTYLALDSDNRRKPCVVKRFNYHSSSAQNTAKAKALFEQEAERLDQLNHAQIPRLIAYFQEGDALYLVQEFIEGQDLQIELAQHGPFSESKIKDVLLGLLPILQFVHSHNVIHRDLKPDNIMRRKTGELVLIDFGIAKLLKQSQVAKTGTKLGTPGYAAPEQTQGRATPASDLFGLGATCFSLLTQGFGREDVPTLTYRWTEQWQQYLKQPISANLEGIITRLIAIEEPQRYATASAVLSDVSADVTLKPPAKRRPLMPLAPSLSPGSIQKVPVGNRFWLRYGLFSYVGQATGLLVCIAIYFVFPIYDSVPDPADYLAFLQIAYYAVGLLIVGISQWLALRKWLPKCTLWAPMRTAGFWIVAFVYYYFPSDITAISMFVVGAGVGLLQWWVLQRYCPRAHWWILWVAFMHVLFFSGIDPNSNLSLLLWAVIAPMLDGLLLSWILRKQHTQPLKL